MTKNPLKILALSAMVAGGLATGAAAAELRVASGSPPTHPSNDPVYTTFIEQLPALSGDKLTAKHFGLEVVTLGTGLKSLESGVVDIANVLMQYFPADFPNSMLLADLAPLGTVGSGMAAATVEYYVTCEDCQAEFAKKGIVYITSVSTPSYDILTTKKKVTKIEDLAGLRLRSPGAAFSLWIKTMGAIPTEISFNEEYEALQGGLIDGTIAPPVNLIGNRLAEVARYYTPIGVGTLNATSTFSVRSETWKGLSEEERRAVVNAGLAGSVKFEPVSRTAGVKGLEEMTKNGGEILEPSEELVAKTKALQADAIASAIENGRERYKISNPEEKAQRFAALVEKWNAIMKPIEDDPAAMTEALKREIWDKI
ncbi:MAG: C4-dicarboxylate TRAP transporter substrate-binding protein, partial [Pseudomonadota bacterium]|nr:C4-dicarboxylate TRAP transporter substrate-binding protein [Pseudomonadota bacterium]